MYDIIVIGAGVAGLTSAIYGLRAGKKVLVLEAVSYGGQIINSNSIDNYPGVNNIDGFTFATNIYNQAIELGMEYKTEKVIELTKDKEVITTKSKYKGKSIIIATGLKQRKLELPNEDKFIGKGVSYCALCDGNFYKNLDVLVVGGGNTALEDVLYLSNICNKVYLVHRRSEFRGEKHYIDIIKSKNNIELILDSNVVSINGDNKLESITLINNKTNKEQTLKISGLFIAIGHIPNSEEFKDIINLSDGYIDSSNCTTNIDGIFVAGDIRNKDLRQLVTATSDGAIAATLAINYLEK